MVQTFFSKLITGNPVFVPLTPLPTTPSPAEGGELVSALPLPANDNYNLFSGKEFNLKYSYSYELNSLSLSLRCLLFWSELK